MNYTDDDDTQQDIQIFMFQKGYIEITAKNVSLCNKKLENEQLKQRQATNIVGNSSTATCCLSCFLIIGLVFLLLTGCILLPMSLLSTKSKHFLFKKQLSFTNTTIKSAAYHPHQQEDSIIKKQFYNYPLFLDLPQSTNTNKNLIPNVLHKCYGLKSSPIETLLKQQPFEKKNNFSYNDVDFYTTKSLCGIINRNTKHRPESSYYLNQQQNSKFRIFLMMQNPLAPLIEKYHNNKNNKLKFKRFSQYVTSDSNMSTNPLIKSILCKQNHNYQVTEDDYKKVKHFLHNNSHVGLFNHYEDAFTMFQEKLFNSTKTITTVSLNNKVSNCVKRYFTNEKLDVASFLNNDNNMLTKDIQQHIYKANSYDIQLYQEFLQLKNTNRNYNEV